MRNKVIKLLSISVIAISCIVKPALAEFPEKPIKIIVPFNAGGETDISARLLAAEMEKVLDQKVIVQNLAGASGMIGTKELVSSDADGYVLEVLPSGPLAMHPHMREIPYTLDDFSYIGRIINSPYLVYVNKDSEWASLDDMIADMSENPGKYFWASSGVGSVPFFAYKDITDQFGVDVKHVPFTDDTGAFQAIAGNRAQVYTTTAGALTKFDVKALSILDKERSELLPEIPAISESDKSAYYSQWMVLVGPKDLPAEIAEKLENAMQEAMQSDEFVEKLGKLSLAPGYLNSEQTGKFVRSESERNAKNIKAMMQK